MILPNNVNFNSDYKDNEGENILYYTKKFHDSSILHTGVFTLVLVRVHNYYNNNVTP